jgi:uncharacterized membrane protein
LRRGRSATERPVGFLLYGRWPVAGLTFQLATYVIGRSVAPNWEDIGRLAAIAAIRRALNYFLERDINEMGAGE